MTDTTKIIVRDFIVPALIGIYPHEQTSTQRVRITVDVTMKFSKIGQDDIGDTISYEGLVSTIRALSKKHFNLVETIAEHLADYALSDTRAASVLVRVEKIEVYAEGSVGTEIMRGRASV